MLFGSPVPTQTMSEFDGETATAPMEPVRTESFALSYAKAADLKALLSDKDQRILSKRGSANVDERTNTLFIQDTSARLEEARRLVLQLDVPVRQVLIEARIVIADDLWGRQLGEIGRASCRERV